MENLPTAQFHSMTEGTQADWDAIMTHLRPHAQSGGARVLAHLRLLDGDCGGFAVDRLTHCLQTATRAHRDGKPEDYVVMALLHDIGDVLGAYNHPDVAAAILKPFVSDELLWIVQHHGVFQGYNFFQFIGLDRNMRDQFAGHEHYAATQEFIDKYDCPAFDPEYDTLPLSFFEPMVMRLFEYPRASIYKRAMAEG
ncbi:putative HD phosphohydrolase [Novosphingobium hassiacum]|uniref:Putative HD phosphohydrolase n=1 Tax=Novosphingobium hassiacum TaxID=173676 RepID=A0A7W5ZTT6_9SPHN|nr:HD domain-containing protein [Novosphingobium hassiacum]MBB3859134.1 putative HD phosphohydrolase [Novosphingobium hassiacum]